ncbi:hypothetical protein P0082_09825 [Candidatus Haliotispira prima]|uniref:Lipoprotein n=1 Tax=Candidatus Haliotispira prima TaxID=3034016 RepID=A0ABY8MFK0_9SPIO|nr:hypothetical protein P0082_09825 [Candidatus Haliotispira prima]
MLACVPLSDTGDPPAAPAPKYTFTISFTGIQALELTANSVEDMAVSAIVRLAGEPVPVWTDIQNKVGLLSRNLVAGSPKRIFTAKHYDTNDDLQTNIAAMSAADILQPETAYKVYVFHKENVITTLPFTTAAVPPASEFPSTFHFAPNVLPFDTEVTYTKNNTERKGIHELYAKEGEVLLIPLYMNSVQPLVFGWNFFNGSGILRIGCTLDSCLPDAGYGSTTPESIYPSIANTYYKTLLGIQTFNTQTIKDAGYADVKDGGTGPSFVIHLIADQ